MKRYPHHAYADCPEPHNHHKAKHRLIEETKTTQAEKKYTFQDVLEIWLAETPHFGGSGPHRYLAPGGKAKYCVYCLRPKNFKESDLD